MFQLFVFVLLLEALQSSELVCDMLSALSGGGTDVTFFCVTELM